MTEQIEIGDILVDVVFKEIKNIHLSVYPPEGRVRVAAPERMDLETIRIYVISRLDWIRKQQKEFQEQDRETRREYLDIESHYVWGQRYLLVINEEKQPPSVELTHSQMILTVRPGSSQAKKRKVVAAWYREELRNAAAPLIAKWEEVLGVQVKQCFIQHMKTKWGSCNPEEGNIRLNTELAKKPPECLEYIIVHEMVHLLERHHNDRFRAYMDHYIPNWQMRREVLNRSPLAHEDWTY